MDPLRRRWPASPWILAFSARSFKRGLAGVFGLVALLTYATPLLSKTAKRPLPDYDGRGPDPTTPADVAIWVPRVLLSPFYLASEFLLRRPIGGLVIYAERGRLPARLADFFTFDAEHKIGFIPTAFVDFGLKPSVGVYVFWDDFIRAGNALRVRAGTWGPDWLTFGVTNRLTLSERKEVSLDAATTTRKDRLFYGLGPRSRDGDRARYGGTVADASATFEGDLTRGTRIHTAVGVRAARFEDLTCCSDPSLGALARAGRFPLPPGFIEGSTISYQRMNLVFDTRARRPLPQSGLRLDLEGQPAFDVKRAPANAWVRYGATAGAFVDLTGTNRVLGLTVSALFADPILGGPIPFNEQISLGGSRYMRGYLEGRLVDQSALIATLQYEWPVWAFVDGTLHVATGNVFGPGLHGLTPDLLRLSSGIGLRTNNSPDARLEMLLGVGTETFKEGAELGSLRLLFGATHGF